MAASVKSWSSTAALRQSRWTGRGRRFLPFHGRRPTGKPSALTCISHREPGWWDVRSEADSDFRRHRAIRQVALHDSLQREVGCCVKLFELAKSCKPIEPALFFGTTEQKYRSVHRMEICVAQIL